MQPKAHIGKSNKGRKHAKMDKDEHPPKISPGLEAHEDQP